MHPDIKLLFDNCFVSKYNSCTLQVSILNIREGFFVKESRLRLRSAGLLSVAAGFMLFLMLHWKFILITNMNSGLIFMI